MGKGVTWLALSAAILVTLVLAAPAEASLLIDGPVAAGSDAASDVRTSDTILGTVSLTTPERTVLALINNARAARGLHRLVLRTTLCRAAKAHSLSIG
jgi:uncharacterized protein YkwD